MTAAEEAETDNLCYFSEVVSNEQTFTFTQTSLRHSVSSQELVLGFEAFTAV
jgi:hypothetical protein